MNPPARPVPASRLPFPAAGILLLALALALAWGNSFRGPLVFDDLPSVRENPSLRQFATALSPPSGGLTVSGRPLLNLSFALNYAMGGETVAGYHAVNLAIHLLAALTLFGLARRTLRLPVLADRFGGVADRMAGAIALLWAVHPLQTESVTYIVQRAESLAGLFYLLTLYGFARSATSRRPRAWLGASVAACLLGALTKETIATAPLLVLLYDRTFVSGSFRAAWTRHRGYHAALAVSWLVLAGLVLPTGNRGGTTGFATPMTPGEYAALQLRAIAHYLRLAVWPHPLVFDYGPYQSVLLGPVARGAAVTGPALLLTAWALWRRPLWGFLGAWFFLLLAPSSSLVPIASQIMAEHRVYLALAAMMSLAVLGLHRLFGSRFSLAVLLLAAAGIAATAQRNLAYRSGLELWEQNVRDFPGNPRGCLNLGQALVEQGQWPGAAAQFEAALQLQPDYIAAHFDLGLVCVQLRRWADADTHFAAALRLNPAMVEAAYNWGNALVAAGRAPEAVERYRLALQLDPGHARARYNLANTLVHLGRIPEAISEYREAVRLAPGDVDAHFNLANALFQAGRPAEAVPEYEAVLRLAPHDAEAARNLGLARETGAR